MDIENEEHRWDCAHITQQFLLHCQQKLRVSSSNLFSKLCSVSLKEPSSPPALVHISCNHTYTHWYNYRDAFHFHTFENRIDAQLTTSATHPYAACMQRWCATEWGVCAYLQLLEETNTKGVCDFLRCDLCLTHSIKWSKLHIIMKGSYKIKIPKIQISKIWWDTMNGHDASVYDCRFFAPPLTVASLSRYKNFCL